MDERRAKGLAYCLSCGQPLAGFAATSAPPSLRPNSPSQFGGPPSQYGPPSQQYGGTPPPSQYGAPGQGPQSQYGGAAPGTYGTPPPGTMPAYPIQSQIQPQKGSGAVGLIIGIVLGVGGLFAIVIAVIIVVVGRSSSSSSSPASDDTPTSTVAIETPPTATATDDTKPTTNATHHTKPTPSASIDIPPTGTQPFSVTRAFERMDQTVTASELACPRSGGPFGSTVVEVTFEPDGRTETLLHLPIAGTPEGNCISAEFLAIRLGPFTGTKRTFSRSVTMRSSTGSTTPTATSSGRTTRPDAGH